MDISFTHYCSWQARGGQKAQFCHVIFATPRFSLERLQGQLFPHGQAILPQGFSYGTAQRVINEMAPGSKSHAVPKRLVNNRQRLGWVLAAAVALGRHARSEARGESGSFSLATESSFGQELRFAAMVKHSETFCVWKVLWPVKLPCNVTAV